MIGGSALAYLHNGLAKTLPLESAARMASTTISGRTSNGSFLRRGVMVRLIWVAACAGSRLFIGCKDPKLHLATFKLAVDSRYAGRYRLLEDDEQPGRERQPRYDNGYTAIYEDGDLTARCPLP